MPSPPTLAVFVGVTLVMLVVPGPSVLFAFTCGLQRGRRAAIFAVLGLETGLLIHVLAASLGISALVASSPAGLAVLKFGGAAYLAVLGLRQLMGSQLSLEAEAAPVTHRGYARIFGGGVLVDVLNPKTLIFFLALLPQFVESSRGAAGGQALSLGLIVVALAFVCDGSYAFMADALRRRPTPAGLDRVLARSSGAGFVFLAAMATFT
jgi:threonine/homoserine/homoserine lactone efflux protein